MVPKGTIRAVGNILCGFSFTKASTTAEEFAQRRFQSKLEVPNPKNTSGRREAAWINWIDSDSTLDFGLLGPHWAEARLLIHRLLKNFRIGSVDFTTGSEFTPTLGRNSIESKLSVSDWTCTPENFELFAMTVYGHRALKFAYRKRYAMWLSCQKYDKRKTDAMLWSHFSKKDDPAWHVFLFKLSRVVTMVHGNRFSTVPKNNLKDRPICIEPFGNILTQRRIGNGIRKSLKDYGFDLNLTAEKHRRMISQSNLATIDLKNASDSISTRLVKYLLPSRIFKLIECARSEMTLGLDGEYYLINKVSSMGNGFTFELMSMLLLALCHTFDIHASVFGDDIIISSDVASDVISALEKAGFIVNREKTHVNDGYRESCGAHFLDGHGYVESYDFRYPTNIGEVITIVNKLQRLSCLYPSFLPLFDQVYRTTPMTWYACITAEKASEWHRCQDPLGAAKLDEYINPIADLPNWKPLKISKTAKRRLRAFCADTHNDPKGAVLHYGFEWVDAAVRAPQQLSSIAWGKYFMYLASGRRCKDTVRGRGTFKSILFVTLSCGATFRWSALSR